MPWRKNSAGTNRSISNCWCPDGENGQPNSVPIAGGHGQTGPAVRNDIFTLDKHLRQLVDHPALRVHLPETDGQHHENEDLALTGKTISFVFLYRIERLAILIDRTGHVDFARRSGPAFSVDLDPFRIALTAQRHEGCWSGKCATTTMPPGRSRAPVHLC